jgi:uncharacterized protein YecE (DUF72 family)
VAARAKAGKVRVGVGGWTFEPWRGTFFPEGLPHKRELEFASRQLTAIEINGTYYGSQKPESFARWHDETPDDFVFAVKGPRFATNRKVLAEAGASVERFFNSGVLELKTKLGPVNWQFLPTKKFEAEDFSAFLKLLPTEIGGTPIRNVVEVRHESFRTPEFVHLLRTYDAVCVYTDKPDFPSIPDVTGPFVYARLQRSSEDEPTGYPPEGIAAWAKRAGEWASGGSPADIALIDTAAKQDAKPRDVFVFMINGHKPKAPAAAMALIERLRGR